METEELSTRHDPKSARWHFSRRQVHALTDAVECGAADESPSGTLPRVHDPEKLRVI